MMKQLQRVRVFLNRFWFGRQAVRLFDWFGVTLSDWLIWLLLAFAMLVAFVWMLFDAFKYVVTGRILWGTEKIKSGTQKFRR